MVRGRGGAPQPGPSNAGIGGEDDGAMAADRGHPVEPAPSGERHREGVRRDDGQIWRAGDWSLAKQAVAVDFKCIAVHRLCVVYAYVCRKNEPSFNNTKILLCTQDTRHTNHTYVHLKYPVHMHTGFIALNSVMRLVQNSIILSKWIGS